MNTPKSGLSAALDANAAHVTDERSRRQYEAARNTAGTLAAALGADNVHANLSGHAGGANENDKGSISVSVSEA
jgi:hypothetical protein